MILYEFLIGVPPYFDTDRDRLYANIKGGPLKLPTFLSVDAKDLIKKLLERNPLQRLGAEDGASQIKKHPFFKNVDWKAVLSKNIFPPERTQKKIKRRYIPLEFFMD